MYKGKKILGIILARSGSKSVKNKNIRKLNGKPLIAYTIKEAIKSKIFTKLIVSTDSKKIGSIAKKLGARVPFLRPKKYAKDNSRAIDAIYYTFKNAEKLYAEKYDYIIELLCTNPLKKSNHIIQVAQKQILSNADSVIAVAQLEDHHPRRIKKIVKGKIQDFCLKEIPETRRQDLKPKAYIRCGSIYSMRRDMLLRKIRYGTKNSLAYVLPEKYVVNIDTKRDFEFAEYLLKRK